MPFKYDEKRKRFKTMGIFCSWPCMKAYNLDKSGPKYGEYQMYITLMRKHVYGNIESCRMAPKRECLKVFGGTMDIDEFRVCKDPPIINLPNEIFLLGKESGPVTQTASVENNTYGKMQAVMSSFGQTDQLKLKRSKPLQRTESSLEKALGIKKKTPS